MEAVTQLSVLLLNLIRRRHILQLLVRLLGLLLVQRFVAALTLIRQEVVLMTAIPATVESVELLAALKQGVLGATQHKCLLLLSLGSLAQILGLLLLRRFVAACLLIRQEVVLMTAIPAAVARGDLGQALRQGVLGATQHQEALVRPGLSIIRRFVDISPLQQQEVVLMTAIPAVVARHYVRQALRQGVDVVCRRCIVGMEILFIGVIRVSKRL